MSLIFTDLKDQLKKEISIEDVYSRYYSQVTLSKRYVQVECPSPSCREKKFTLFSSNSYKCFSCEIQGDIFELFKVIHNTNDFRSTIYTLARDFGYMTQENFDKAINYKYNNYSNKNYTPPTNYSVIKKKKTDKPESTDAELQPLEVRSNVYEVLSIISPVTDVQKRHLELDRNLDSKSIERTYFNMPKVDDAFMSKLYSEIKNRFGYEKDMLIGVPGFYKDKTGKIMFVNRNGLGIKERGANGSIYGIQVRIYESIDKNGKMIMPKKEIKCKYYWVSSSEIGNGCTQGCSIGSPVDVMLPENIYSMYRTVFITEGKFKSEAITKKFCCPSISVQGVGSWRGKIAPEIKYINDYYKKMAHAYICYDADMATNQKVYNQCKNMIEEELIPMGINCQILVWDYHFGKGIDDLIINGHSDKIKKVNFKDYVDVYNRFLERIHYLYPKSTSFKILDDNNEMVDDEILGNIYKIEVLEKLNVTYL